MTFIFFAITLFPMGLVKVIYGQAAQNSLTAQKKIGSGSDSLTSLIVLDPVDIGDFKVKREWGDFIRDELTLRKKWIVISRDTVQKRLLEYKLDAQKPCHEFQCAFDTGNMLPAEFVLFSSLTRLDQLYTYTLNLIHVPSSQVVWSRIGDMRSKKGDDSVAAVKSQLSQILSELDKSQFKIGKVEKHGLMSVIDLSQSTPYSRAITDRITTQLFASRNYDLMGQKELEELLLALNIRKRDFLLADSALFDLGQKMDIAHLAYSRLTRKGENYRLQLAMFDIKNKQKVREWPAKESSDFRDLLQFENKFFATLFASSGENTYAAPPATKGHSKWTYAAGIALGVTSGLLCYQANQNANDEYKSYQNAQSAESALDHKKKSQAFDKKANGWGLLSGVAFTFSAVLWVF